MASRDEEVALLVQNRQPPSRSGKALKLVLFGTFLAVAAVWTVNRLDIADSDWSSRALPFILDEDDSFDPLSLKVAPVNFLAVGDWGRHGMYNQTFIAHQMGKIARAFDIDFVVSTGDNFYKHGLRGVNDLAFDLSFSKIYTDKGLQKPWYAVLGNHDYHGDVLAQLDPRLNLRDWRWHGVREGQIAYDLKPSLSQGIENASSPAMLELFFIDTVPFIDQYWGLFYKRQFDWRGVLPRERHLERKVENLTMALNASKATWKIVVGHHTIRSYGKHGDSAELVRQVLPILETYNVDVYLNGHDHCMEHVKRADSPIHYVTSGGGSKAWKGITPPLQPNGLQFYYDGQGFVLFSASKNSLKISYYDIYGKVVHSVELSK